jgi:hypothetical protein
MASGYRENCCLPRLIQLMDLCRHAQDAFIKEIRHPGMII